MPTWKGWNENEVRESKKATGLTTMAESVPSTTLTADISSSTLGTNAPPAPVVIGFTPINAPNSSTGRASRTTKGLHQDQNNQAAPHVSDPSSQARSVASEYLGRGDGEAFTPAAEHSTRVTRGSTAKKKSNASKKRAATTNTQAPSKRRKTSDIADSMLVTKSKPRTSKAKPKSTKQNEGHAAADVAHNLSSQPVSLFSSSTSMEALTAPSQQTSLDAVRASQGFGTTLYYRPHARTGGQPRTVVAKPWLGSQGVNSHHQDSPDLPSTVSTGDGAAKHTESTSSQPNQQQNPTGRRMFSSRTISEDFMIGEDDGLEEAMALADSLEREPKNGQKVKSAPNSKDYTQPQKLKQRTADQSKDQAEPTDRRVDSSKTLSESFIISDDEEMDEGLAVVERLEVNSFSQNAQRQPPKERKKSSATANDNGARRCKSSPPTGSKQDTEQPQDVESDSIDSITSPVEEDAPQRPLTPPARQWKLNMREVNQNEDYGGALFSEAERKILDSLKTNRENGLTPIVRGPFPRPILDRSPLFGASSTTTLRTCFRIGEALKEGTSAVRSNHNTIIELYARVVASHREGRKQHFVFHDLYHDRPPYLEGVCELWNQTKLWELDTRSFLHADKRQEGVMCRAIARMKSRDGADSKRKGWRLEVLSVWEAGWEDVEFVAGIYGKGGDETGVED